MRRKYQSCTVNTAAGGYELALDDRPMRTPAGRPFVVGSPALAEVIAAEWNAVPEKGEIRPLAMPMTRLAVTAIDRVAGQRDKVVDDIVAYGRSDLLCYRAEQPVELAVRQAAGWDPWLDWVLRRYGAGLRSTQGVMPIVQDEAAIVRLRQAVAGYDDFTLAALFNLTTLLGSLVLALAVLAGDLPLDQASSLAEIDAAFQVERWGEDLEATRRREAVRRDIAGIGQFLSLLSQGGPLST